MDSRMNIRNGEIELTPAPEADIDVLFTTVAREFGERAVCVLLAGDESRGFEGLEEAASMGAVCFAQDERTALFESWKPKAAGSVRLMEIERIAKVVRRRLSAGGPRKPMERDS
jgi:chemotaxis response regulator CheB